MTAALCFEIYSLLLSQLPSSSSSFVYFYVRILHFLELLPSYSFFFHAYITIKTTTTTKKQGKCPFASDKGHYVARQTSEILRLLESRPCKSFISWTTLLEKGPPKITEGGSVGLHWLNSRRNPCKATTFITTTTATTILACVGGLCKF